MMRGSSSAPAAAPASPAWMGFIMKQNKLSYKIGQYLMFGGPATILFFAVVILPFFYGLYLTFTSWDGVSAKKPFVGLDNYKTAIAEAATQSDHASLLSTPNGAMFCLILVSVWQYAGYMMLIYVAGFMSVDQSLKEAAMIDGCNKGKAMWHVVIPLMRASFVQCIFLSTTRCFMVYDLNLSLTKGEPFNQSVLAAMHVYNQAFVYKNYGTGQAEALVLFIVCAVIGMLQVYFGKKGEVAA